jgi:hypothetical protein
MRLVVAVLAALAFAGALPGFAVAEPKAPVDPSLVASDTTLLQDETKAVAPPIPASR